ncbi:Amino acid transporter, transmembrane domain [Dillenia turbinata]|uniref:Amino acid transporter, transmembrane domain n=1 Tax=Dillenia turbinata TaxID=194707 RepID=A0AAN8ZUR8_9MAGN
MQERENVANSAVECGTACLELEFDEDGQAKRTGTWLSASAHIITAVIGSGVLSLTWAVAQLGWLAGTLSLFAFAVITWFAAWLLADSNRPDPTTGKRNHVYMDVVRSNLGGFRVTFCGIAQYTNLVGVSIGYTITAAMSMVAVVRSNCLHKYGHDAGCHISYYPYMIIFGAIQLIFSQIPNFHKLSFLSYLASIMSFTYATIGIGLAIAKVSSEGNHVETSLGGTKVGIDVSAADKIWKIFQSLGNIAFTYTFSNVLVEIQASSFMNSFFSVGVSDTIQTTPAKPAHKAMKKASTVGIFVTTLFYALCGLVGYAAFGNNAPGNFLSDGFTEPYWLIDFANVCIAVHLMGAYQVFAQPLYQIVEKKCAEKWPESGFIMNTYPIHIPMCGKPEFNLFHLVWRSAYVAVMSLVAIILPFFNDFVGLMGALAFWPLTVFLPIEMYIARQKLRRFSVPWICLQTLSMLCLIVSILATVASINGLVKSLKAFKPFHSVS